MAKKKSITRSKPVYSNIRDARKPQWMRVIRFITVFVLYLFVALVIAGIMLKYYRQISNHN